MTLPAEQLGDQGQRYEVHADGYPGDGDNVISWTNILSVAIAQADNILLAPSCEASYVLDRKHNVRAYG